MHCISLLVCGPWLFQSVGGDSLLCHAHAALLLLTVQHLCSRSAPIHICHICILTLLLSRLQAACGGGFLTAANLQVLRQLGDSFDDGEWSRLVGTCRSYVMGVAFPLWMPQSCITGVSSTGSLQAGLHPMMLLGVAEHAFV
jgi:hypothetical protein